MTEANPAPTTPTTPPRATGITQEQPSAKAQNFRRLANRRADTAIAAIERLGNLASPAYSYEQEQITTLETALTQAVENSISRLRNRTAKAKQQTPLL